MEVDMFKKKNKLILIILILGFISIMGSFSISAIDKKKRDELYSKIEIFSDALAIIQDEYVEPTDPKNLIYGALKGMLSALDQHSQFLDPETYNELKIETEGKFGGLGIEITIKDGLLTVVTPLKDTPAWRAGIKPQDRIVKIDGSITRNITLTEAVKKLRGKPGTEVTLTILREKEKKILEFKLVRDIIKLEDIKDAKILEDGIAYIRLVEFRENTATQLENALKQLRDKGMEALILDLRNNPGGLLDAAVKVASKFIEKGKKIVSTKGKKDSQNIEFISKDNHPYLDLPLVVLVNEGSASGSEIVAGALQDWQRAIILGKKTFGKGSVQTVFPLNDGSALRLTTSKYFTPKGKLIHNEGITPDIIVEELEVKELQKTKDEPIDIFEELEKKETKPEEEPLTEYRNDYQLLRAIDLLKAIQIYKKK
ncbi:MAG: S41 family peptidase [Candidatus Omnitrophica bacterium]|nr:S41 family peptidase [Candidatus Omnitrophota bacterium]